jgi:hypothetical protein
VLFVMFVLALFMFFMSLASCNWPCPGMNYLSDEVSLEKPHGG